MEAHLLLAAIIAFGLYALIDGLLASIKISNNYTPQIRSEYGYIERLKSLVLPLKYWVPKYTSNNINNLIQAHNCWYSYIRRLLIAFAIFTVFTTAVAAPSYYVLLTK